MLASSGLKQTFKLPIRSLFLVDSSLEQQLSSLGNVFHSAPVGLCVLDLSFRYVTANPCFARMYRLSVEEFPGRTVEEVLPGPAPQIIAHLQRVLETRQQVEVEIDLMLPGLEPGTAKLEHFTYLRSAQPIFGQREKVVGFTVSVLDITTRRRAEQSLRESEENLRYTVELTPHIPWTADASGELTYMSPRWNEMVGRKSGNVLLKDWFLALNPADRQPTVASWQRSVRTGDPYDCEYRVRCKDATWRWVRARAYPRRGPDGGVVRWYGTVEDITDRKLIEASLERKTAELNRRAHEDHLTGLANRRHFDHVLEQEIERARHSHAPLALVLIDVDHFKQYNDSWGHVAGDECLRIVAATLESLIGRSGNLAARFGGEEFALILPGISQEAALEIAQAANAAISLLNLRGSTVGNHHVTISAGLAMFEADDKRLGRAGSSALIEAADSALYSAKARGRNCVVVAHAIDETSTRTNRTKSSGPQWFDPTTSSSVLSESESSH